MRKHPIYDPSPKVKAAIKQNAGAPDQRVIDPRLFDSGWRHTADEIGKKTPFYGLRRKGLNYEAIRVAHRDDGTVEILALPENLKEIAIERIRELLENE